MPTVDLTAEMNVAGRAVRQAHLDRLRALGVSNATIAGMGVRFWPFGVTSAEAVGGGYYQPGEGVAHIILPVLEDETLIDLVAFRSTAPDEWLLRTGTGWALGLEKGPGWWMWHAPADPDAKPPKHEVGTPTHLFSNPLDWLQGGGDGICVLDWSSPEVRQLDCLAAVTVSDHATAALLTTALTRPVRLPQIEIMGGVARAA